MPAPAVEKQVVVNAGQTAVVEVRLRRMGIVMGSVENQSTDSLLKGVRVSLMRDDGSVVAEGVTGDDGHYRFPGVHPGTYRVKMIVPKGYVAHDDTERTVEVAGGGEARADFSVFRHGSIEGHVVTEAGEPVANADVELVDSSGSVVRTGRTDAAGAYSFRELPVDKYTVRVAVPESFESD